MGIEEFEKLTGVNPEKLFGERWKEYVDDFLADWDSLHYIDKLHSLGEDNMVRESS